MLQVLLFVGREDGLDRAGSLVVSLTDELLCLLGDVGPLPLHRCQVLRRLVDAATHEAVLDVRQEILLDLAW